VSGCLPQRFREELPRLLPEVDAFMGIDQVAQVADIVRQAVANRASRRQEPGARSQKQNVVGHLNELEKNRAASVHEKEESIRGTKKFGKTKTVIEPAGPSSILHSLARRSAAKTAPSSPLLDVTQ